MEETPCSRVAKLSLVWVDWPCCRYLAPLPRSRATSAWSFPLRPAGAIDAIGRLYAERMKDMLGQNWVVENRAGANNTLGAAEVARAAPDGTTLLTNADIHSWPSTS